MDRRIFLIGYRGSGKSSVGCVLAERLGWSFVDADIVLEEQFGKSIRQIFDDEGEPGFRDKESAILTELSGRADAVIATGGGVVLRDANRHLLSKGFVVWLTADPATLWARIQADTTTAARRPALTTGGLKEVEQLLAVREPLYRDCANLVVDVVRVSPEHAADTILAAWSSHWPKSLG